jgi:outer membrane protein assembly factor BamB
MDIAPLPVGIDGRYREARVRTSGNSDWARSYLIVSLLVLIGVFLIGCEQLAPAPAPTPPEEAVPAEPAAPAQPAPPAVEVAVPAEAVPAIPPEVEQFAAEWPMANRDYANTRATFDSTIDSSNVDQLGVAWTMEIPGLGSFGAAATAPLIADGTVYFQDLASNVFALDLESGVIQWSAYYTEAVVGPNGPALGWGKLFVQGGERALRALDMATGEQLWSVQLGGAAGAHQPYVYGGYVLTGIQAGTVEAGLPGEVVSSRGYQGGASGIVYGVDQATGEIRWGFQTVEEGFWGNPEVNSGGGIWYPPAIDVETGLTFWGTGNPAPFPGTVEWPNATSRPGPNLYTNAIIALAYDTGEFIWYNQVKPFDLFDLDFQLSPILATIQHEGQEQTVAISAGKLGRVLAFDRQTGETVWDTWVGIHQNDELQEIPLGEEIIVYPGVLGGVETPMALADGVVYATVNNLPTPYTATAFEAEDGTEAVGNVEARTIFEDGTSEVVAIDANTGEILWVTEMDNPNFGGATVVNDLVFTSTYDGIIYALAREDGAIVWSLAIPGGINAWPSVAGDTILFPVGIASPPMLVALRLGAPGTLPAPQVE